MLALAAQRCEGTTTSHSIRRTHLAAVEDAELDAVLSVQVLEYVADVPAALSRCTTPCAPAVRLVLWNIDCGYPVAARHRRAATSGSCDLGRPPRDPSFRGPSPRDSERRVSRTSSSIGTPSRPTSSTLTRWRVPRALHARFVVGQQDLGRRANARVPSNGAGAARRILLRLHPVLLHRDAPRLGSGGPSRSFIGWLDRLAGNRGSKRSRARKRCRDPSTRGRRGSASVYGSAQGRRRRGR